jgi:branched-chain amino acid transport system ATP-binding protein
MTALLQARGLRASYKSIEVLHGIDFAIEKGGVTAILGANGAGKTTTLRALSGMVATQGDILFEGAPIQRKSTEAIAALGVGHVPDGRGTIVGLTVEENLRAGGYTRRPKDVAAEIERMYHHFPRLKERRHQQAGSLSGGEQQMLAISRALMLRPKLLLLDEPSFGLAPQVTESIFDILRALNERERMSILLVEQNAALALELADRAYLLETGRIVMSGKAEELANDESIRKAYLGY